MWERGLPSELGFWKRYIETRGLDFPEEFSQRVARDAPVDDSVLLEAIDLIGRPDEVRIVDVGAGPLTSVGRRDPRDPARRIEVVAVDPLADAYNELLRDAGVAPPVLTQACRGEDIAARFADAQFDIAYARNSLDHAVDPLAAIGAMLSAVRVGGAVVLHHYRREGETNGYEQLHQWNFDVSDGRLLLYDRRVRHDIGKRFAARARTTARIHDGSYHSQWVAATLLRLR
jgi:SAM-dependent methyltransferase